MIAIALACATSIAAPPLVVTGRVHGSIEATLADAVPADGPALAAQVARLLRWRGDVVRNVQPDDVIRIIYEPNEMPELVALAYQGAEMELLAYRHSSADGSVHYYDHTGELVEPLLLDAPVPNYIQITEVMQSGRGKRRHTGLDLKAEEGAAVLAPSAARVNRVNWLTRLNGLCVELVHDDGTLTRYLHLHEVDSHIEPGRRLAAGTRLGSVGSTGRSSAPHLHYDIRDANGHYLDPLEVHGTRKVRLTSGELSIFFRQRAQYDRMLGITDGSEAAAR